MFEIRGGHVQRSFQGRDEHLSVDPTHGEPAVEIRRVAIPCGICGHREGNRIHSAREMMYGLRETFDYMECVECGCLQLLAIPEDISPYYADGYYSLDRQIDASIHPAKLWAHRRLTRHHLGHANPVGRVLALRYSAPPVLEYVRNAGADLDSPILDVGSGAGNLLLTLAHQGFSRLTGVDPYIERELFYPSGVHIVKGTMDDVEGPYDLVMMHHSLEHVPDQHGALRRARELLTSHGCLLVRTPVASSYAWREYGTNWVQLDAPRHTCVHTVASMRMLAESAGFTLADIVFDSSDLQFWGSEQYRSDIPLRHPLSYAVDNRTPLFTEEQIQTFRDRAAELNANADGDSACFYLSRVPTPIAATPDRSPRATAGSPA
jgi:SAM-dependent methyltransferase